MILYIHTIFLILYLSIFHSSLLLMILIVLAFCLSINFNRLPNAPRPHEFIVLEQVSATNQVIISISVFSATALGSLIILSSAYLFASCIFFDTFTHSFSYIASSTLIYYLEHVLANTVQINRLTQAFLENPDLSNVSLSHLHQYLTPYIRSQESTWLTLLFDYISYLERTNDANLPRVYQLLVDLREVGNEMLELYRRIEGLLNISIDQSPISLYDPET